MYMYIVGGEFKAIYIVAEAGAGRNHFAKAQDKIKFILANTIVNVTDLFSDVTVYNVMINQLTSISNRAILIADIPVLNGYAPFPSLVIGFIHS